MVYSFSVVLAILVWLLTWEVGGARGPESSPRERSHTSQEAAAALPWRKLTGICVITLFASVMFYTIQTQSGLALSQLRVRDPAVLGLLTTFASLGVPAGTLLFRSLARLPVGYLLAGEFVLIGLGFAWMGKSTEPHLFVLAAACNQLGCGMVLPTLLTWAARGLQYEVRGRGIGIWTGTFSVGQFLSGVLVTLLASAAGGVLPAFVVLGAMSLVAALLALGAQLYQRAPATTSASHS
jgi:MFS family permease